MEPQYKRGYMHPPNHNYIMSNVPCESLNDFLLNVDSMAKKVAEKTRLNTKAALHFFKVNEDFLSGKNVFKSDTATKLYQLFQKISSEIGEDSPHYITLQKIVKLIHRLQPDTDILLGGGEGAPILQKILGYTSSSDLGRAAQVCKMWNVVAEDAKISWVNSHPEKHLSECGIKTLDDLLEFVKKNGHKLQCLNLLGHKYLLGYLTQIISCCHNIKSLCLDCEHINQAELKCLVGLPLKSIRLVNCVTFDDQVVTFLRGMQLTHIAITRCPGVCDHAVVFIKQQNMPLEYIEFTECDHISTFCFDKFPHLPNLEMVYSGALLRSQHYLKISKKF